MKKVERIVESKKYIAIIIVSFVLIIIGIIRSSYAADTSSVTYSRAELRDAVIGTALTYLYNNEYSDYSQKAIHHTGSTYSDKALSQIEDLSPNHYSSIIYYTNSSKSGITYDYRQSRVKSKKDIEYTTVKDGETLKSIAEMYSVTESAIRNANGLTTKEKSFSKGKKILIPNATVYSNYSKTASYNGNFAYFRNLDQDPDTLSRTKQMYIDCSGFVTLVYKYGLNIDLNEVFRIDTASSTNTNRLTTYAKEHPKANTVIYHKELKLKDNNGSCANCDTIANDIDGKLLPGDLLVARTSSSGHVMLYVGNRLGGKSGEKGIIHATGNDMHRELYDYQTGKDKISIQYTSSYYHRIYNKYKNKTVAFSILRPINALMGASSNTVTIKNDTASNQQTLATIKKATRRAYFQHIGREQYATTSDGKMITRYSSVPKGSYIKYIVNLTDKKSFNYCQIGNDEKEIKACNYQGVDDCSCKSGSAKLETRPSLPVVRITAKIPAGTKYVKNSCTNGCTCSTESCEGGSTLTWNLPSGSTGLLGTYTYMVDVLSTEGKITNQGFTLKASNNAELALGNIDAYVEPGTRKQSDRETIMQGISDIRATAVYKGEKAPYINSCAAAYNTNDLYSLSFAQKVYCETYGIDLNQHSDSTNLFRYDTIFNNFFSEYTKDGTIYNYDFSFTKCNNSASDANDLTKMYVPGLFGGKAVVNTCNTPNTVRARYITESDFEVGDLIIARKIVGKNTLDKPTYNNYTFIYAGNNQFITFDSSAPKMPGKLTVVNNDFPNGVYLLDFRNATNVFTKYDSMDYFVNNLHNYSLFVVLRPAKIMTTVKYNFNGGKSKNSSGAIMSSNYYSFLASKTYKNLLPSSRIEPPTGKYTVTYSGTSGGTCDNTTCPTSVTTSSLSFKEWQINGTVITTESDLVSTDTHTVKAIWKGLVLLPQARKDGYTFKGWKSSVDGKIWKPSTVQITQNTTMTAQWEKNAVIPTAANYCLNPFYNGGPQSLVRSAGEGYTWSGDAVQTNANSYKVKAILKSGYAWTNSNGSRLNKEITCNIRKRKVVITAKNQSIYLESSIKTGTGNVTVSGLTEGDSLNSISLTPSTSLVTTSGTITPSGAIIKKSGTDVTNNYDITYRTAILTIKDLEKNTVIFNSNGGSSVVNQQVTKGSYVTEPTSPSRTGYDFLGWYKDSTLTNEYDFANPVISDLKLYAKWTSKKYLVTFNTRGGSYINSKYVSYGDTVTRPTIPTKAGYAFAGWYTDSELMTSYDFSKKVTKAIVLYAKWNVTNYHITYNLGGGYATNPNKYTVETSTFTLNRPTKTGYTFMGWTGSNGSTPQLDVNISKGTTGNKSFSARYDIIRYTVEFNTNGGSSVANQQVIYGGKVAEPVTPTKAGYAFAGWYTDSGLTNKYDFTTKTYSNKTLYALWISGKKQITYDLKGGAADNPTYYDSSTSSFTLDNPEKEGSVFVGWTGSNGSTPQLDVTVNPSEISNVSHIYEKVKYKVVMLADSDDIGDLNYTANYTDATYTISFNYVGLENIEKLYGESLDLPTPEKEGYRFLGWYRDEQLTEEFINDTMPAENLTLYPKFEVNTYKLVFITNGGNAIDSLDITYNENIPSLPTPEKEGYGFLGWYADEELTQEFNIEKMPANDIMLYAKWQASIYTTHFNTNGGTVINDVIVLQGDELARPSDPIKNGYLFDGWYSDSNFDNLYDFSLPVTKDLTLYAKWILRDYSIDYNLDGGTVSGNPTNYNIETPMFSLNNPTRVGYTFKGWTGTEIEIPTTNVTVTQGNIGNRMYIANYEVNNYTITFNSNGGSSINSITAPYGEIVDEPMNPTKSGYRFAGWYRDSELTKLYTFTIMPAENIILYAKWTTDSYIISYMINEGINDESNPTSYNGGEEKELKDPTRVGYRFLGWYKDSTFANQIDLISPDMEEDLALYAKWEPIEYIVEFVMNGANEIPTMKRTYKSSLNIDDPERIGYTFKGWYTDSALTEPFTLTEMPADNLTLYATWKANRYTIVFDSNGGNKINPITAEYNSIIKEPNKPLKEGYKFAGWFSDKNLTNLFSFDRMPSKDMTLYAKWIANGKSTIKYVLNGGKNSTKNKTSYKYGDIVKLYNPKREGYEFLGWYLEKDYQTRIYSVKDMSGDLVLYAKWLPLGEIEVPDTGSNIELVTVICGIALILTGTYFILNRKPNLKNKKGKY